MTPDEEIQAIVATGKFTLPAGLTWQNGRWSMGFDEEDPAEGVVGPEFQSFARQLCAIHFAQENYAYGENHGGLGVVSTDVFQPMRIGKAEIAIKSVYDALKTGMAESRGIDEVLRQLDEAESRTAELERLLRECCDALMGNRSIETSLVQRAETLLENRKG